MPTSNDPTRVLFVQPTLATYRVPVYGELASRPEIDLRLWYGDHQGIKNADPEGFSGELKPIRSLSFAGQELLWHSAQLEAVKRKDVDVVVLSWGSRYLSLRPALRRARQRGLPVLLWGHGFSKNESPLRQWSRDRLARLATVLMLYDEETASVTVERGWPADRVFIAPNAIDQVPIAAARESFLSDESAMKRFREQEGIVDRSVLLYVSRFAPENRLDILIEAIDRLRHQQPEVLAVLVGGGQEYDRIQEMVESRGLMDHVRLVGPIYEETLLAPWFLSAEAFVYPAAIGLSLLHAFGYGLPVVTSDDMEGHNPEIIAFDSSAGPNQNGITYLADDADSLADRLHNLLNDNALRQKLGQNALAAVRQKYNVPAMVDGMVAAIERCAELGKA